MAKNNLIVKSNQVIEASYSLTAMEQRLILCAIAQVPIKEEVLDSVMYPISLDAVAKLSGNEGVRLEHLREALNRLYDRSIVLRDQDKSTSFRWIQQKTETKSGELFIRFSAPILPFLSNLNESFTKYLESDIIGISSPYAIRFYELMMQYRSVGKREISLEDLRWMFQLQDKYPIWADLKKRVIDQSVKEINEYSPYKLTIEPKKTGRKITSIVLKFQDKKALKAPKGKVSSSNYEGLTKDKNTPDMFHGKTENEQRKGMTGIGSITNAMMQKNTDSLSHRIRDFTEKVRTNTELQKRVHHSGETHLQMGARLRAELQTDEQFDMYVSKFL